MSITTDHNGSSKPGGGTHVSDSGGSQSSGGKPQGPDVQGGGNASGGGGRGGSSGGGGGSQGGGGGSSEPAYVPEEQSRDIAHTGNTSVSASHVSAGNLDRTEEAKSLTEREKASTAPQRPQRSKIVPKVDADFVHRIASGDEAPAEKADTSDNELSDTQQAKPRRTRKKGSTPSATPVENPEYLADEQPAAAKPKQGKAKQAKRAKPNMPPGMPVGRGEDQEYLEAKAAQGAAQAAKAAQAAQVHAGNPTPAQNATSHEPASAAQPNATRAQQAARASQAADAGVSGQPNIYEDMPDVIDNFPYMTARQMERSAERNDGRVNFEEDSIDRFDPYNTDFYNHALVRMDEGDDDEALRERLMSATRKQMRKVRGESYPFYREEEVNPDKRYKNAYGELTNPTSLKPIVQALKDGSATILGPEDATPVKQSRVDKAKERDERVMFANVRRILMPSASLPTEGSKFVESAETPGYYKLHRSKDEYNAINRVRELYECSEDTVMALVQYAMSLGVDYKFNIAGKPAEDFKLPSHMLVAICNQIVDSQREFGHPMGVVNKNYLTFAKTYCFPSGYVDSHVLREITRNPNSALYGVDIGDIRNAIAETWRTETRPDIIRMTHRNDNRAQRVAVFNFVRAAMAVDNERAYDTLGVQNKINRTFYEIMDDSRNFAQLGDADMAITSDMRGKQADAAIRRLQQRNLKATYSSDGEEVIYTPSISAVGRLARNGTRIMRAEGVADPVLLVANGIEKFKGNALEYLGNKIAFKWQTRQANIHLTHKERVRAMVTGWRPEDREYYDAETRRQMTEERRQKFRATDYLYKVFSTDQAGETMTVMQMLLEVGGLDALEGFAASRRQSTGSSGITDQPTMGEAKEFLDKYVYGIQKEVEQDIEEGRKPKHDVHSMMQTLERWTNALMTGNGLMGKADARRFMEMFLIIESTAEMNGEPYVDTRGLEESISGEGIQRTMFDMVTKYSGQDALLSTNNLSLGRRSPTSTAVQMIFSKHPIIEFFFSLGINKYIVYGIRLIEVFFPMSNTCNWLMANGMLKAKEAVSPKLPDGARGFLDEWVGVPAENALGVKGLDGLKRCIVYDCMQLGTTGLMALMWCFLHMLFDDDDDDDGESDVDKSMENNYLEYGFNGLKIVPAWWSNDLTGWGLPAGTALYVAFKYKDPERAKAVLVNGCAAVADGSAILDTISVFEEWRENAEVMQQIMTDPDFEPPEDWGRKDMSSYMIMAANAVTKNFTPAFIRNYMPGSTRDTLLTGEGAYDRSAYERYANADDAIEKNKKERIDSYNEILARSYAKSNPTLAIILDLANGIMPWENGTGERTGYMAWQMPIATKTDQVSMMYYNELNIDDDWRSWDQASKDKAAEDTMNFIEQNFDSVDEAVANGFVLPYNARENLKEYLNGKKVEVEYNYLLAEKAGVYGYVDGRLANVDVKQQKAVYDKWLNDWVYNSNVPSSMNRYWKLISDYEVNYVNKTDGTTATWWDWVWDNQNVERVYTPLGNHPTSFSPYTTVDGKGYNQETESGWYRNGYTDVGKILDMFGDRTIEYGQDKGKLLRDVIMGSQDPLDTDPNAELRIPTDSSQSPTINRRGYVYKGEKLPDDYDKADWEASAARMGINYSEFEALRDEIYNGSNSSGRGRGYGSRGYGSRGYGSRGYSGSRGGGGGGGSYNPKIYSSKQRVYSNRAEGMNVKSPYKATNTYLRPQFATKGSREAYRRQDM